jgi:methyl halide transferase
MSWEDAWRQGRTGWDAGASAPALIEHLQQREVRSGERALVAGCGSGYDVFALAEAGVLTHGVDIAPTAAQRFKECRDARGLDPAQAQIHIGDFFEIELPGRFELAFDYTFLCAIEPERRPEWVERMHALIRSGGELISLVFPVNPSDPSPSTSADPGPPYRLHPEVVTALLEGRFAPISIEPIARSHPGRKGKEFFARYQRLDG